jgi:hypothetical protein
MPKQEALVAVERVEKAILLIRRQKVMLDRDLAVLYEVPTRALKQAVRRNIKRFPPDFMFELTKEEFQNWRSQFVTSNRDKMGLRYKPMAFTEQGVAMLSSVLNSDRAIDVNIEIMRAFVRLRRTLAALEEKYDEQFKVVFEAIHQLMTPPEKTSRKIGFEVKEKRASYGKKRKKG